MKVIDLLNKIANGEDIPKMFKYNDKIWRLASNRTYFIGSDYGYDFWVEHGNDKFEDEIITLNDEVEIIEEPQKHKIEKLNANEVDFLSVDDIKFKYSISELEIVSKINEIIDYLEGIE